jgi:hypothetical protein
MMRTLATDRRDARAMKRREVKRVWSAIGPAAYWEPEHHADVVTERLARRPKFLRVVAA